jgi:hypothetical protein
MASQLDWVGKSRENLKGIGNSPMDQGGGAEIIVKIFMGADG